MRVQHSWRLTAAVAAATMIGTAAGTLVLLGERTLPRPSSPEAEAHAPLTRLARRDEPLLIPLDPIEPPHAVRTALADESDFAPPVESADDDLLELPLEFPAPPPTAPQVSEDVPGRLPTESNALPLEGSSPERDAAILDVIRRELPDLSEDEQRVWLEELRALPLDAIPHILQLRRNFGGSYPSSEPVPPPVEPLIPEIPLDAVPADAVPADVADVFAERVQSTIVALEQARDVIFNNIANAQTPGFRRSRVVFAELPYQQLEAVDEEDATIAAPLPFAVGLGVYLAATELDPSPGRLEETGRPLDAAIDGAGFFQVNVEGEILYTRNGHFGFDESDKLVLIGANAVARLEPAVSCDGETADLTVTEHGVIAAAGDDNDAAPARRLILARFRAPEALAPRGDGLYAPTNRSGEPQLGEPGEEGFGALIPGALEGSNVQLAREIARWRRLERQLAALREMAPQGESTSSSHDPDQWWGDDFMSPEAREIERNLGIGWDEE